MTASAGSAGSSAPADEQAIRERVRELTAQMLTGGRLDAEGVTEVVRALAARCAPTKVGRRGAACIARDGMIRSAARSGAPCGTPGLPGSNHHRELQ